MQKDVMPVPMDTMVNTLPEQSYAILSGQVVLQRQTTDHFRRHLPNDSAEVTLEMHGKLAGRCKPLRLHLLGNGQASRERRDLGQQGIGRFEELGFVHGGGGGCEGYGAGKAVGVS